MKRSLPLAMTLVFALVFVGTLALQIVAADDPPDPAPLYPWYEYSCGYDCCTFANWCGHVGYGSSIYRITHWSAHYADTVYSCEYFLPNNECWSDKCLYLMPANCGD